MTVAWGFTPGAVGSSDASLTRTFSVPWMRPWESAAHFAGSSPSGTVEQRCTVMTDARVARNPASSRAT